MRLVGRNLTDAKSQNLSVILRLIHQAGVISRTELARETGLSNPTVSNLVNELFQLGLVKEAGSLAGSIGRSRVLLSIEPDSVQVIGIEIKRNGILGLLTDLSGEVRLVSERAFRSGASSHQVLECLHAVVDELHDEAEGRTGKLVGVGIGTPGPVDVRKGLVFEPPNFPGLRDLPLQRIIEERHGLQCVLNDDARTSALGEAWFGAGRDAASLVFISLGEGIGSGVILDYKLYEGAHDIAGQIGHFTVEPRGARCDCGNLGCLETVASIPAIAARTKHALRIDDHQLTDSEIVQELLKAYRAGIEQAARLCEETIDYVVTAVLSAVNAYDPEVVILGGRLIQLCPDMVEVVKRRVRGRIYYHIADNLKIARSQLGDRTSALGGVTLLLRKLLDNPLMILQDAAATRIIGSDW
jgi:N-acetylglucosamine repressor